MGALTDLEVERVDAVDRPATRRKFLITKAEGDAPPAPAAAAADATKLLNAASGAIDAIRKAEGLVLPDGAVDALNALVTALDPVEGIPFAKSAAAPVVPAVAAAPAGVPAAPAVAPVAPVAAPAAVPAAIAAFDEDAFATKIATAIVKAVDAASPAPEREPSIPIPPSSQPPATAGVPVAKRAVGSGMFESVIFGSGRN